MPTFDFRIRFNFTDRDHLNSNDNELLLLETPEGQRIILRAGASDKAIKELSRVAIQGGPYPSPDAAAKAASLAKQSVMTWAIKQRFGVDFGDSRLRSLLTQAGLLYFGDMVNQTLRNGYNTHFVLLILFVLVF